MGASGLVPRASAVSVTRPHRSRRKCAGYRTEVAATRTTAASGLVLRAGGGGVAVASGTYPSSNSRRTGYENEGVVVGVDPASRLVLRAGVDAEDLDVAGSFVWGELEAEAAFLGEAHRD